MACDMLSLGSGTNSRTLLQNLSIGHVSLGQIQTFIARSGAGRFLTEGRTWVPQKWLKESYGNGWKNVFIGPQEKIRTMHAGKSNIVVRIRIKLGRNQ